MAEEAKSPRELVVIAKPDAGLRAQPETKERVASATEDVTPLSDLLKSEDVILQPLFGLSEERMLSQTASLAAETGEELPDL